MGGIIVAPGQGDQDLDLRVHGACPLNHLRDAILIHVALGRGPLVVANIGEMSREDPVALDRPYERQDQEVAFVKWRSVDDVLIPVSRNSIEDAEELSNYFAFNRTTRPWLA